MASGGEIGGSKDRQKWADSKVYRRKSFKGLKTNIHQESELGLGSQELNSGREVGFNGFEVASDDSSSLNRHQRGNSAHQDMQSGNGGAGAGFLRVENRVSINLASKSKKERQDLRRRLEGELNLVRSLVKKIERNGSFRSVADEGFGGGKLKRVHSEVGSIGGHESRAFDQLSVNVMEHSQGASDNVEKQKRTTKANQLYQSSDFILGKEKIPPSEQGKKTKKINGEKNKEAGLGFGMSNSSSKVFKSCSSLLEKMMKHKHGWVFDSPVDVKGLGLHDYFTIIKHPMDLGTVKSRLNTNWYKSPKEFAEDVRLTFHNATTYNPKGHDVHIMAEQLLKIFEEKWAGIEAEYLRELRAATEYDVGLPTPTSRRAPPPPPPLPPPIDMSRVLDRSESMTNSATPKPKNTNHSGPGRTPVPKKPKAKDPNKREMTYLEKQKLSTDLQNLPSEKLDNVVQIIRKRNPSLCQNDDEIEVDIDSVDTETLWELDRFVMNYKKNLSKMKREAEMAKARGEPETNVQEKVEAPCTLEEPKDSKADDQNPVSASPVQGEKQGENASKSNSSRSSSSDSGSFSSESDSDSSSA